ncbi:MAG: hypothetical protein Kow006_11150 [Gammaproteobacteria bacterium]
MRGVSDILLFSALVGFVAGASWPWWLGLALAGLVLRPGMPLFGMVLGAIVGLS